MSLALRIRKIREIRGLKQSNVARELNITQQSYGNLESQQNNPKLETLLRFCDVMKLPLSFLLDPNIPITDENVELFTNKGIGEIYSHYQNLKERLEYYEEIRSKKSAPNTNATGNLSW
jgi:transcriptional regulator with XRE-family HTH domain